MSRTQKQITIEMFNALTDLSEQLLDAMEDAGMTNAELMRKAKVSKCAFDNIKYDWGYMPNLSTVIALFDKLGFDEITIKWR